MKNTTTLNVFTTGSFKICQSAESWSEVVEWNIQLLRHIIANLFWTSSARIVYVPSVAERVVTFGLIAAGVRSQWCLTRRKETGEVLPGRGGRMKHKIKQSGGGDEAPSGKYLNILWNGLWNFTARIGSWLQWGEKNTETAAVRWAKEQNVKWGKNCAFWLERDDKFKTQFLSK